MDRREQLVKLVRERGRVVVSGHYIRFISGRRTWVCPVKKDKEEEITIELIRDDTFTGALVSQDRKTVRLYDPFDSIENAPPPFSTHWDFTKGDEFFCYKGRKLNDDPVFVYEFYVFEDYVLEGKGVIVDWDSVDL